MWVAQHCKFDNPLHHLSSGGLGTMGYGLPAAIGAKVAKPESTVVCVSGDGSIMMNVQELATLKRYGIDVKILLLDNSALGLVRQWQEIFFEGNYSEVHLDDNPDFAGVARAFGIQARSIKEPEETTDALEWLLNSQGAAYAACFHRFDGKCLATGATGQSQSQDDEIQPEKWQVKR